MATFLRHTTRLRSVTAPSVPPNSADPAGAAPTRVAASRLPFIDALRGVAAMWVVIFHISEGGHIAALQAVLPDWVNAAVFRAGHLGVPIFFVLSGFVIALSIGKDRVTARYVGRFALRRAIRLDLPYWASIAITLGFAAVKTQLRADAAGPVATVPQVLAHMFYLQDFLGYRAINTVYWTLCFEIQFYLLFCILLGISWWLRTDDADRRAQAGIFAVAAVASIIWPLVQSLHLPGLALTGWHGFLIGAFTYWCLSGVMAGRWLLLYGLALLGVFSVTRDPFTAACVVTATIIYAVGRAGHLTDWLGQRAPQFLGRVSYSIYLLHLPIEGAAFWALNRVLPRTPLFDALSALLVIAIALAGAQLFWWAVERPSTALARRLRTR